MDAIFFIPYGLSLMSSASTWGRSGKKLPLLFPAILSVCLGWAPSISYVWRLKSYSFLGTPKRYYSCSGVTRRVSLVRYFTVGLGRLGVEDACFISKFLTG
jgi:hypothetical protein